MKQNLLYEVFCHLVIALSHRRGSRAGRTLTLQDERGQLHNVLVEGGGHGARLQVGLELQEELVPRDLLPQLARAARVELDPKVELVHAAPCKE